MSNPRNHPVCGVCATKLVKNGTTSAGRTRWRCKHCGASTTRARDDITRKSVFDKFLTWLLGTSSLADQDQSIATFRRRTQWCWNVAPTIVATGVVYDQIMLDGTYFNGWCVLIAHTGTHVIDWQWCDREKTASWTALLERIPAPTVAIIDGNAPLIATVKKHWPDTRIQRCYFHIRQAGNKHLTRRPRLPANRALLHLYTALPKIRTLGEAAAWTAAFASWEAEWESLLKHRTYATSGAPRPNYVRPGQKWWYTHIRTRRAWKLLAELITDGHLFTWLELAETGLVVARATSALEGGPNKAIKDFLRAHRGLAIEHARRGIDWLLYLRTEAPKDPWAFVTADDWVLDRQRAVVVKPETGREETNRLYGTGFSVEDGNGIQKGWGGRSR
ncbi:MULTISPECIES: IS1249 family transposase [Brevibacterium]|uniref:IS1249 family transposase n=1 Tax=Brevibacterium TaxID=1696 RepID=UPI0031D22890